MTPLNFHTHYSATKCILIVYPMRRSYTKYHIFSRIFKLKFDPEINALQALQIYNPHKRFYICRLCVNLKVSNRNSVKCIWPSL